MKRRALVWVSLLGLILAVQLAPTTNEARAAGTVTVRGWAGMSTSGTHFDLSPPSGLVSGDVMVGALSVNGGGAVTPPTGWVLIGHTESLGVVELWTYYRVAGPSEPAIYSWTTATGAAGTLGIVAYTGVDTTSPLIGFSGATDGGGSAQATAPAVTSSANSVALLLLTVDGSFSGTLTYPAGFTQRWALVDYEHGYAADNLTAASGNLPARTITLSSANFWSIQQVGLRVASGAPPPSVTTVVPNSGPSAGASSVTINGSGFQSGATVSFGGAALTITSVSATAITGTTPAHAAGVVDVVVTNPDAQTGTCGGCFTYVAPAPTVTAVTPSSGTGAGGTQVTVNGSGFQPGATVTLGGVALTVSTVTPSAISGTTGAHAAGTVDVTVRNTDGQTGLCSACFSYTPVPPPTVSSVSPSSGSAAGGTPVTVNGSDFQSGATVSFGGAPLTVSTVTPTGISGTTSAHVTGTVNVVVTNPDAQTGTCIVCFNYTPPPPPTVSSVTPSSGSTSGGTSVTVNGTGFLAGATASFGGSTLQISNITSTTITGVTTGHPAGAVDVIVTNPESQSGMCSACFTYATPPPPVATAVNPNNGSTAGGTSVNITGTGFQAGAAVSFGGSALSVATVTSTSITGTTSAHVAGAVSVIVTNPDTQTGTCANCFTYVTPPSVTLRGVSTSPGSGARTSFVIPVPTGIQAKDVMIASLSLNAGGTVTAPAGWTLIAHTVNVGVIHLWTYYRVAGATEPASYTWTSASGSAGVAGIAGYVGIDATSPLIGFSSATGQSTAASAPGITSSVTSVALLLLTIDGSFSGTVSYPSGFTQRWGLANYEKGYAADRLNPIGGNLAGAAITLSASNYWSIQQVALRVSGGGPAPAPSPTSVTPATGSTSGGTTVTVNGTGFQSGATVSFGGSALTISNVTATAISGTTTAHTAGAVNVVVTNPDAQTGTCVSCFTYAAPAPAPTADSINPNTGTSAGGTSVTVNGTNFQSGATASLGGAQLTISGVTPTAITGTTRPHAAGAVNVVVTNPDGQSASCTACFSYIAAAAPSVTSAAPNSGSTMGGDTVTVNGANFQSGASVSFGGSALTVTTLSATAISGTTTAHVAGAVDVAVTNPDAQTATCAACFTYINTGNAIQSENALPGTPGWNTFSAVADQLAISGYSSKISATHGESVDLFITTKDTTVSIDIFRVGYYGGVGARRVASLGSFPGRSQAIPAPDPATGMVAATGWTRTTTLTIPTDWVSGVYLAKLTGSPSGHQSFIFFVVRNDGGHEKYVFQNSVTTYQAYNIYGGTSLYDNQTNKSVYPYGHATKVSFDRPFDPLDGNGAGQFTRYEYPWVRWAESQGYDLTYITDVDTATNVNPLTNHKAFLAIGHDEYWSKEMRDNVTAALAAGVNLGFFTGNEMYWQIRLEPNALGVANRVQVGYKDFALAQSRPGPDPFFCPASPCAPGTDNSRVTTEWRAWPVSLPEQLLVGVMFDSTANAAAYVVQNSTSWVYSGTGLSDGSKINGIVGYEYDRVFTTYVDDNSGATVTMTPQPGLVILSNSPVGTSHANSTLYTAASGARVFAAGTIEWSSGLDSSGYGCTGGCVSAALQRTTRNILNNFAN